MTHCWPKLLLTMKPATTATQTTQPIESRSIEPILSTLEKKISSFSVDNVCPLESVDYGIQSMCSTLSIHSAQRLPKEKEQMHYAMNMP